MLNVLPAVGSLAMLRSSPSAQTTEQSDMPASQPMLGPVERWPDYELIEFTSSQYAH